VVKAMAWVCGYARDWNGRCKPKGRNCPCVRPHRMG